VNKYAFLRRALPIGAALAIGSGAGAAIYAGSTGHHSASSPTTVVASVPAQSAAATTTSLTQLYKNVAPGVVDIVVNTTSGGFGDQGATAEGSGFVVDTSGDIVTNDHVVTGATSIKVRFQDGKTVKATVVGTDPSTDVAVIKVDVAASELHPLTFAS
jgi:putative serine protease PepD